MIEIFKSEKGQLKQIDSPLDGSWINLVSPTDEELSKISLITEIPEHILSSLKDVDEISDIEKEENMLFIIARTPQKNMDDSEVKYSTIPLGIIILDNHLITICSKENDVINQLKYKKVYTSKKVKTTLLILLISAKRYLIYLNEINKKLHLLQEGLKNVARNEDILNLSNIQKSLVYFSTSLKSNQFLIERLTKTKVFTEFEQNIELLDDIIEENKQAIEMTNIYTNITSNMTHTFSSVISNNLSNVMKLLTSITLILMLPTLVSSIYGMNVSLPFQNSHQAFMITIGFSIALSLIGVLILWRKKLF